MRWGKSWRCLGERRLPFAVRSPSLRSGSLAFGVRRTDHAKRRTPHADPHENLYHQFMLITVIVGAAALVLGGVIGWLMARDRAVVAEARLAALDQDKFLAMAQRAFTQVGE